METSLYWYIGSLQILTNTYTTALTTKQVARKSVVSSMFNRAYTIITNKDDLHKENARIKQVLKENGYRESIINKIFRITNNHSLPLASVKSFCLITVICPYILISQIVQLLLIRKFYCFCKGSHISFKYARHNHLHCPMMGDVSLET